MHNGDTSSWRNPWKINEPVAGGTSLSLSFPPFPVATRHPLSLVLCCPRPFSLLRSPVLPIPVPISLTAARRHSAPCGGCGKNPRRTRINAIMNLSRWDLTIQDVATTPLPLSPNRRPGTLRHPEPATPHLH